MAISIKRLCIAIVVLYANYFYGETRDSIAIDHRWNSWRVESLSPNGDWALVYQMFPNNLKKSRGFVVNIDTGQRVEVTGFESIILTSTDAAIVTEKGQILVLDLKNGNKTRLGKMTQQDWIVEQQLFSYRTEAKEWSVQQFTAKGTKNLWSARGIANYWLLPNHEGALYQREGSSLLYRLDFKKGKEIELADWNAKVRTIYWNESGSHCVIYLESTLIWLDVEQGLQKRITLPEVALPRDLKVSFFPNSAVYLSYTRLDMHADPRDGEVDIWNGNDRDLKNKMRSRPKGDWKAFVYSPDNQKLQELPRSLKQEYLNIGIDHYLLVYEPLEYEAYLKTESQIRYRLFNLKRGQEEGNLTVAFSFETRYQKSAEEEYILYPTLTQWEMYDFKSRKRVAIPHQGMLSSPIWSADGQQLWYQDGQNVWAYEVKTQQHIKISNLTGSHRFGWGYTKRSSSINKKMLDLNTPFWFYSINAANETTYYNWYKGKLEVIVGPTNKRLNTSYLQNAIAQDGKTAVWMEEHYNQPPTVNVFRKRKVKTLLKPELPSELYAHQKQKVIHYQDSQGSRLTGVLWYPKNFKPHQKYPMVTQIYERLGSLQNEFVIPTFYNFTGFNRALLTDQGYFVFQPDTYVSEAGAGLSALACVTLGIEAITKEEEAINQAKIGLMGHSFGGYETSFILGHSNLFATGVSGAGIHDLINNYYDYNETIQMPNYFRTEGSQIDLRASLRENSNKYHQNSPILAAQDYHAPVLLWTGAEDTNVPWRQTRNMFTALVRYEKNVIALYYPNEGHSIRQASKQYDLTQRLLDWFEHHLKNRKVEWISKGVDNTTY